jgi:hypothetical protein
VVWCDVVMTLVFVRQALDAGMRVTVWDYNVALKTAKKFQTCKTTIHRKWTKDTQVAAEVKYDRAAKLSHEKIVRDHEKE